MDTTIKTQDQLTSVKQFNCTNCGNALSIMHPRAQYISCPYCGSVLDASSETHQILTELDKPSKHKPLSFIQLGQRATFDGVDYQVIARTRWRMKYKEYWREEGESGYSDEVWNYDEWLLIDRNRTYFYLIEDKEGYRISEEIIPETPMLLPRNLRMSFFNGQSPKIVREYGSAEAIFFEGESNYQIKVGDTIRFAMFKDRSVDYSAEWRLKDKSKEIKEIEFFKEIPVSRRRLLESFAQNEAIEQLKERESFWSFAMRASLIAAAIMLALGIFSIVSDGTELTEYTQQFEIRELSEDQPTVIGPIDIQEQGLYKLILKTNGLQNGGEIYLFAYVMDKDKLPINTLEGSFYYYTGYEDGESYTESDDEADLRFKLEEPGQYYIQLYRQNNLTVMGQVKVSVHKGVMMARYFFFVMAFCLILAAVGASRSRAFSA